MGNEFARMFMSRIKSDWRKVQSNNFDRYRFPGNIGATSLVRKYGRIYGGERLRSILRVAQTLRQSTKLQHLFTSLADDESRQLLVAVLAFRSLGHSHVKLPLNNSDFWNSIEKIESDFLRLRGSFSLPSGAQLDDYDLTPSGSSVRIRGHLLNVLNAFVLQQYRLERDGRVVEVESGDVVIDAGGCWGDTALYFANRVGKSGIVYCYEFDPDNLTVFRHNMDLNPEISRRVHLVQRAVWSKADEVLHFVVAGPSSHLVSSQYATGSVITDTIDEMSRREGLKRVDFIKMDIEGAELDALKGAEATIRRYRPKLAISVYHRLEHFWEIPSFINSLGLGYEFFIEHFTIHAEETMLFAVAPRFP